MIQYPIAGDTNSVWVNVKGTESAYPVSNRYMWHNGMHVAGTMPVVAMADGKIVAMRLASDYKTLDLEDEFTLYKLKFYAGSAWGDLENQLELFFDKKGTGADTRYTLKSGLAQDRKDDVLRLLGAQYSTSFLLLQHTVQNRCKHDVSFYTLYMHLKPLNCIPFELLLKHPWYRMEGKLNAVWYYGVRIYTNSACTIKGIVIPSETKITIPDSTRPQYIEWSLNGQAGNGYIKDVRVYRLVDKHYEIKRPTDLEKDDGKRYCDPKLFEKAEGQLLYTTADAGTRIVSGTLNKNESIVIVNPEAAMSLSNPKQGLLVNYFKDGKIQKTGYLFLTFPYTVTKDYSCLIHDTEAENKKLKEFRDKNSVTATCSAYGIDFSIQTSNGVSFDTVCSPEDNDVRCGDELGYPGLYNNHNEICHIEVFASDVEFMKKDKGVEDPCDYIVAQETNKYLSRPTTVKTAATMPGTLKTITSDYTLKLKENGRTYRHVSGEEFVEVDSVYKKVHQGKWCIHTEMFIWDDQKKQYYQPKNEVRKILIAEKPETLNAGEEITIYPTMAYVNIDSGTVTIAAKNGRPEQKAKAVRKIKTFYEKVEGVPSPLYILKNILDKRTTILSEHISDIYNVTTEIVGEELLSKIDYGPMEPCGKNAVGTTLTGMGENASTYVNKTDEEPNATWIKVAEPGNVENVQWLNMKEVGGKGSAIEKLVYNDWLIFFKQREKVENAYALSSLDTFFTDEKDLATPFNKNIKEQTSKYNFGKLLLENNVVTSYLSKVVYQRPSEWKTDDGLTKELSKNNPLQEKIFQKLRTDTCFWDDAKGAAKSNKSVIFPKSETNWYIHPIRFVDHLNKVELKEINPYLNRTIPDFKKEEADIVGNAKEDKAGFDVKSNPGFAPLANGTTIYTYDNVSYAICTSPYGILRYSETTENKRLAHSGIDLAPSDGKQTDVISFIYGQVWACTWASIYGNVMIIKNRYEDKLYLLAHLDEFKRNPGDFISPGQTVAICGGSAFDSYTKYGVHLHLEVRTCKSKIPLTVLKDGKNNTPAYHAIGNSANGEELAWSPEYKDNKKLDPFKQDA